jgi:hypothetical protein
MEVLKWPDKNSRQQQLQTSSKNTQGGLYSGEFTESKRKAEELSDQHETDSSVDKTIKKTKSSQSAVFNQDSSTKDILDAIESDSTISSERKKNLKDEISHSVEKKGSASMVLSPTTATAATSPVMVFDWMFEKIFPAFTSPAWVLKAQDVTKGETLDQSNVSDALFQLWSCADVESDLEATLIEDSDDWNSEEGTLSAFRSNPVEEAVERSSAKSKGAAVNAAKHDLELQKKSGYLCSLFKKSQAATSTCVEPLWSNSIGKNRAHNVKEDEDTDEGERDPTPPTSPGRPLFPTWSPYSNYTLEPSSTFTEDHNREAKEMYIAVKTQVDINVVGNGGGFDFTGWPGIFWTWFHPQKWLSVWKGTARGITVSSKSINTTDNPKRQLNDLDTKLCATVQYFGGTSKYMTVITYNEEHYGVISLYEVEMDDDQLALCVYLRAYMTEVPRRILRDMKNSVKPNRIDLLYNNHGVNIRMGGGHPEPTIINVKDNTGTPWDICGRGWSAALKMPEQTGGLVATIPQMVAYCHIRLKYITCLESSPIFTFEPLNIPKWKWGDVRRGVTPVKGPEGSLHEGKNIRVAVLFPRESRWSKELFFWA